MRPTTRDGLGGGARVVLTDPPRRLRAPEALAALIRPLRPGRLVGWRCTPAPRCATTTCWFDVPVDLDFVLHDPAEVVAIVEAAGLDRGRVVSPRPVASPRRDHAEAVRRGPQAGLTRARPHVPL